MKFPTNWFIKILMVIGLIAGAAYLHWATIGLKQSVAEKRNELETNPGDLVYASAARSELEKHRLDIQRVKSFIPTRANIVAAVTAIEGEGARHKVTVSVTDIQEIVTTNGSGQAIAPGGPIKNVRMKITAVGPPASLIQLLHGVESLPYLLHFEAWDLVVKPEQTVQELQIQVPAGEALPVTPTGAILSADVIIATVNSQ